MCKFPFFTVQLINEIVAVTGKWITQAWRDIDQKMINLTSLFIMFLHFFDYLYYKTYIFLIRELTVIRDCSMNY